MTENMKLDPNRDEHEAKRAAVRAQQEAGGRQVFTPAPKPPTGEAPEEMENPSE